MSSRFSVTEQPITRREALRRTVIFTAGALTAGRSGKQLAAAETKFPKDGMHLLALGDFGTNGNERQVAVANRMAEFANSLERRPTAVLALGDNFYSKLTADRFENHFEKIYSATDLDCPFYACLGNHDYGTAKYDTQAGKLQMQLDYARNNPQSRWKMPAKWYTVELPTVETPLVKIIVLDGNYWEGALTPKEKIAQRRYLDTELKKRTSASWLWVVNHFPLYSDCPPYAENKPLVREWGPLLKRHPVSLFMSGHAHILQHLRVEGFRANFIVSGGGGAKFYKVKQSGRGYVSNEHLGFNHIHVTKDEFHVQFIDAAGECLHHFRRDQAGRVEIMV